MFKHAPFADRFEERGDLSVDPRTGTRGVRSGVSPFSGAPVYLITFPSFEMLTAFLEMAVPIEGPVIMGGTRDVLFETSPASITVAQVIDASEIASIRAETPLFFGLIEGKLDDPARLALAVPAMQASRAEDDFSGGTEDPHAAATEIVVPPDALVRMRGLDGTLPARNREILISASDRTPQELVEDILAVFGVPAAEMQTFGDGAFAVEAETEGLTITINDAPDVLFPADLLASTSRASLTISTEDTVEMTYPDGISAWAERFGAVLVVEIEFDALDGQVTGFRWDAEGGLQTVQFKVTEETFDE
ncbi:hypothetical protein [Jannaschia aquimarina]|uniref:Uncharacterized protein n=1 Tax=Jannaschia aquimarina TaxID=935700 RepID=A0A0D1D3X7_9RHOB|nr:hypothetical protein [Jannaschia aquimarina]KIT14788.1 hypothetical protein jaqu_35040 [Jannaschia aquimarina]SNT43809.1 hypothetical protein SAMN05421775_1242 [Jannaschia aquimarina]